MSLKNYHKTIGGFSYYTANEEIFLWHFGCRYRNLSNYCSIWHNGSTYTVGYERNTTNNQVIIIKQTGLVLEYTKVGSGTTSAEPLQHPTPSLFIDDAGYIYVFQNKLHIDPFRYWKSDSIEDVSAFTYQYDFTTEASYLGLMKQSNTDVTFVTRKGGVSSFSQSIVELDLTNGSFVDTQVTDVDYAGTDVRHYPLCPIFYGTSTYRIGGINHRVQLNSVYYKTSLWVTSDFDTFENIGQTFSVDVPATAAITDAQLDTNYAIIGSDSDKTIEIGSSIGIQINDDFYIAYQSATNQTIISKWTIGTSTEISNYTIPFATRQWDVDEQSTYLYYNGSKLVLLITTEALDVLVYTLETDLTGFTYKKTLNTMTDGNYTGLPSNLNDVDGRYLIVGRSVIGDEGNVPFIITDNTW